MANSVKIYVATTSAFFFAAKAMASKYGWLKGPAAVQHNEPWLVLDTYYRKAYYTVVPPDSGAVTPTTMAEVKSYMPTFASANTNFPSPTAGDEYDQQLVLIYS